jgi:hypothetical protein
MSFVTNIQNRFAMMAAVAALLVVIAIGVLASGGCPAVDDYGICIPDWGGQPAPPAPDASDILEGLVGG